MAEDVLESVAAEKAAEKAYDIWKSIAVFLAGVLLTLTGFWALNFRSMVTRNDVEAMIDSHAKISAAQSEITQLKLEVLAGKVQALSEQVARLNDNVMKR